MGEQNVEEHIGEEQLRTFMKHLLDDVRALEQMLGAGMIESGVRRIGAEQEMFLIDDAGGPANMALKVLERLDHPSFTTELARFNLEANLEPFELKGRCLSEVESEIDRLVLMAREAAQAEGGDVVLVGILPTLRLQDLGLESMTPKPRYLALNKAMLGLRGGSFQTLIKGLDELQVTHDNILLEACNTSFQLHFQVGPEEFASLYNLAQAVTAPVLACSVNSPVLLGHRLWSETRIALFQQSIDVRSQTLAKRGRRTRVSFGERWVDDSVIEIFREDISRLRAVLATGVHENSLDMVARGLAPELTALRLYNGTVYRWNRPCYGVHEGQAHLRIENRVVPSGPTPRDEVANAAFYFGLMSQALAEYGPIHEVLSFDDAKGNFISAARHGLAAQMRWTKGRQMRASDLILHELLPLARQGLRHKGVDASDVDLYLGIIRERVERGQTGSNWMLRSWSEMESQGTRREERGRSLVKHLRQNQWSQLPIHEWPLAARDESATSWHSYVYVSQVMSTDLFTVRPGDVVDLAASVMDWERVRHVPVEDDSGALVGLVSHRDLLKLIGRPQSEAVAVEDIMKRDVLTVAPDTPTVEAIQLMSDSRVGCLPVVDAERGLVGLVTESDFLDVARRVIQEQLELATSGKEEPAATSDAAADAPAPTLASTPTE